MTQKEIFFEWLEQQRQAGLKSIHFTPGDTRGSTEESLYAELNRMVQAPVCEPDLSLFPSGKTVFTGEPEEQVPGEWRKVTDEELQETLTHGAGVHLKRMKDAGLF